MGKGKGKRRGLGPNPGKGPVTAEVGRNVFIGQLRHRTTTDDTCRDRLRRHLLSMCLGLL